MIRHLVTWNFEEKDKEKAQLVLEKFHNLQGKIEGLIEIECIINVLESSTSNMLLDTLFINKEALDFYQNHHLHKECGAIIKEICKNRNCIDYEME